MTEGIIEKVFNNFNFKYMSNPRWNTKFANLLKKELIAEIIREFEQYPYYNHNARDNRNYVLRIPDIINKLIGDSE